MFGLGKKKIDQANFGLGLLQFTSDVLATDGSRALGCAFSDFDASGGSDAFLLARGISKEAEGLFVRLFVHASIQAALTELQSSDRLDIVRAAMLGLRPIDHYDVDDFLQLYELAMLRQLDLSPEIAALQASSSHVVVEIAKSILQVYRAGPGVRVGLIENFGLFAGALASAVGTVRRASTQLRTQFKPSFWTPG